MLRRTLAVLLATAMFVPVGCGAGSPAALGPAEAAWCGDHDLPDPDGGLSVASVARELKIASPAIDAAVGAMEAAFPDGAEIVKRQLAAMAAGDTEEADRLAAEYRTWQADTLGPLNADLAAALVDWRKTPEYAEACRTAYERGGTAAGTSPGASTAPAESTRPTATPTGEPTAEPTEKPTEKPTPTPAPGLVANGTINYTSSTYVGRVIDLKVKVSNRGGASGRFTVSVEALGFTLKKRTPLGGCVPDCWGEMNADGLAYAQWNVPKKGVTKSYTVQLKAKVAGTYRLKVRLFDKTSNPDFPLSSWTITVKVH